MRRFTNIYRTCIGTAVSEAAAYRLNFILSMCLAMCSNILFPLVTILIYNAGASFPGWSIFEVLLIQSIFLISSGLAYLLWEGMMWATMFHVREGTFEIVLLKPLSPLFYLTATSFNPQSLGTIIGGSVLFGVSLHNVGAASAAAVGQFLLLFAGGFFVLSGINLIMAATSFKWVGNSRIPEIFDSLTTFGKYPIKIFPQAVQTTATFIIPVGMIAYYPAEALLGKSDMTVMLAVVPCVLFMLFGAWLYSRMIRAYEGVGG